MENAKIFYPVFEYTLLRYIEYSYTYLLYMYVYYEMDKAWKGYLEKWELLVFNRTQRIRIHIKTSFWSFSPFALKYVSEAMYQSSEGGLKFF